ncbi:MAG: prephenate dehydrogenase [Candidatus Brocadiia bacterium]
MTHQLYTQVSIVGPGLIGGSIGMVLRTRGLAGRVVGIGRRESSLQEALDVGAVDEVTCTVREGVAGSDLVILATPIRAFRKLSRAVVPAMETGAVLSEVASTKMGVIETLRPETRKRDDVTLIPSHPMAGSEKRGAPNASEALFENSTCILTPLPGTPADKLSRIRELWEAMGAAVHEMSAEEHDRTVAAVSHLPHLGAACVARIVAEKDGRFAGGGYMDTTRVASGDPRLWRDICESNAGEISTTLESFAREINTLRELFRQEDFDAIEEFLARAKQRRDRIVRNQIQGDSDDATVQNRDDT